MPVERIIGIDFGTSTSVVKIKSYRDNKPMESKEMADYVRFDNKDSLPTLVYKTDDGDYLIGYEAINAAVRGTMHQNFKLDLVSEDIEAKNQAIEFTRIFFKYLYKACSDQNPYFPICDKENTYVSYPAKWPNELVSLMIEIAKEAGFKNVAAIDEPTAAMYAVMILQIEKLQERGLVSFGDTANILMIDMGAGTTDLVLCRYKFDNEHRIEIINTWPQAESKILFGGREIDEILCEYIKSYLMECGVPNTKNFKEKYMDRCKAWKESNLSPIFKDCQGVVKYCGFIDTLLNMLDLDNNFPPMGRGDFEALIKDYMHQFPMLINGCLEDAREKFNFKNEDLDFIILTGGHSQWYFVEEILNGSIKEYGTVELPKVQKQTERIIKLTRPQETVALGLVYQRLALTVRKPVPKPVPGPVPTPEPVDHSQYRYGNTAGNIANNGYVAYYDGWVYYANRNDGSKLYKMRDDGCERTKLCEDKCNNINVMNGWVFYNIDSFLGEVGLYKIRTDGSERTKLGSGCYFYINIENNWIYYHQTYKISRIRTDRSILQKLTEVDTHECNVVNGWIYYISWDKDYKVQHKLFKMRTDGTEVTKLCDDKCWTFNVVDDWIYYRVDDGGGLYKMRTDGSEKTKLTDEKIGRFNVVDGWIYYVKAGINRMRIDGSEKKKLSNVGEGEICICNGWVYYNQVTKFHLFKDCEYASFRMRLDGSDIRRVY